MSCPQRYDSTSSRGARGLQHGIAAQVCGLSGGKPGPYLPAPPDWESLPTDRPHYWNIAWTVTSPTEAPTNSRCISLLTCQNRSRPGTTRARSPTSALQNTDVLSACLSLRAPTLPGSFASHRLSGTGLLRAAWQIKSKSKGHKPVRECPPGLGATASCSFQTNARGQG